jgi:hypothetical protein
MCDVQIILIHWNAKNKEKWIWKVALPSAATKKLGKDVGFA